MNNTKLIVAIDTPDFNQAKEMIEKVAPHVDSVKLGMEFVYSQGFDALKRLSEIKPLFLDLKLHDIPNTVAKGIRALTQFHPLLLTIHAQGGSEMIKRARAELGDGANRPQLLAVTVLTSLDEADLHAMGINMTPAEYALKLGKNAIASGADGLVCSPHELNVFRKELGNEPLLVTPGIRPASSSKDDQKRIMTPKQAKEAGSSYIVVGRPITQAEDPAAAAKAIKNDLI